MAMKEGKTLKAYSDRYWELYNEIGGNNGVFFLKYIYIYIYIKFLEGWIKEKQDNLGEECVHGTTRSSE